MKILVLFIFICSYSFSQQENPYFIQPIEECIQIIGGLDSLQSRLQYPINAIEHSIEGNVYLLITVDSTGFCTNQKIIKSLGLGCDEEAIRLVQTAKFLPAILNSKNINSECMIRIIFRLPREE